MFKRFIAFAFALTLALPCLAIEKNVAGQKVTVFAFDSTTNAPKTGDAANIDVYLSKDGGAATILGDTSATELDATNAKGSYQFDLTQAETNANDLTFTGISSTANVVIVQRTFTTTPPNFGVLAVESDGMAHADAKEIEGADATDTLDDVARSIGQRIWYVSNTDGTGDTGTYAAPFDTVDAGVAAASPGDTVRIRDHASDYNIDAVSMAGKTGITIEGDSRDGVTLISTAGFGSSVLQLLDGCTLRRVTIEDSDTPSQVLEISNGVTVEDVKIDTPNAEYLFAGIGEGCVFRRVWASGLSNIVSTLNTRKLVVEDSTFISSSHPTIFIDGQDTPDSRCDVTFNNVTAILRVASAGSSSKHVYEVLGSSELHLNNCTTIPASVHASFTGDLVGIHTYGQTGFDGPPLVIVNGGSITPRRMTGAGTDIAIRNTGDSAALTGRVVATDAYITGSLSGPNIDIRSGDTDRLTKSGTVTVTSQTVMALSNGPPDNDALNGATLILTDASNSDQTSYVTIEDYVGSNKTATLRSAPTFTVVTGDKYDVKAGASIVTDGIGDAQIATGALDKIQNHLATNGVGLDTDALDDVEDRVDDAFATYKPLKATDDTLTLDIGPDGQAQVAVYDILGTDLTQSSGGRAAGNFSTFWDNADAATAKVVNDVGSGGGGGTDWSSTERGYIRWALGMPGTQVAIPGWLPNVLSKSHFDTVTGEAPTPEELAAVNAAEVRVELTPELDRIDMPLSDIPTAAENRTEMDDNSTDLNTVVTQSTNAAGSAATAATESTAANTKAGDIQSRLPDALVNGNIKAQTRDFLTAALAQLFTVDTNETPVAGSVVGESGGGSVTIDKQDVADAMLETPSGAAEANSVIARLTAIGDKTVNLPADPADQSELAAAISGVASDVAELQAGGVVVPVNQVPVSTAFSWTLTPSDDGFVGVLPITVQRSNVGRLFRIDCAKALATNGRLIDWNSAEVISGAIDGITLGEDIDVATDYGVDKADAKIRITTPTAGTYIIRVKLDNDASDGGGETVGDVKLIVKP